MPTTLDEQIKQLKQAIAELEAQRSILGDVAVDATLVPSRQRLAELEVQAQSSREEPIELPSRQRKLVTLLYMDVVGSTTMTQHLDPEDTLEIMDNALTRLAASVEAHGGLVTRYTGDGRLSGRDGHQFLKSHGYDRRDKSHRSEDRSHYANPSHSGYRKPGGSQWYGRSGR